ncbi:Transcription repressor OFP6 [Spatholobus suberectus]|nr:Transcription repressor OFP6 [Spatholobus suberectus]
MSSNKRRLMRTLLKANGGCGCSKLKSADVFEPNPKPKISIYQNTNPSSLNSSTTSGDRNGDDDGDFTSTTISEADTHQDQNNKNNGTPKPSPKLVDSIAVEKDSKDPHKDFRDSMVQMIFEREIYTETDLQELLECFLQLNATRHHEIIVQAFMEICEEAFPKKNISGGAPEPCRRNQIIRKSR